MLCKCVLCDNKAGKYNRKSHTSDKYYIYKCNNCGLEYTAPIPTDIELQEFYSKYNDIRANTEIVIKNCNKNIEILKQYINFDKNSLFLDFGCGNGEFVNIFGENCYGAELSTKNNNERIKQTIEELNIDKFRCITMFGVLEHINDIKNIMSKLVSHLEIGGYLVITTVDAEGSIPYYYKPPEHLTYWTRTSFEYLASLLELEITYYEPYEMFQYSHIYLDRLLSRTPLEIKDIVLDNSLKKLPETVTVPTNEIFVIMKKKKNEKNY